MHSSCNTPHRQWLRSLYVQARNYTKANFFVRLYGCEYIIIIRVIRDENIWNEQRAREYIIEIRETAGYYNRWQINTTKERLPTRTHTRGLKLCGASEWKLVWFRHISKRGRVTTTIYIFFTLITKKKSMYGIIIRCKERMGLMATTTATTMAVEAYCRAYYIRQQYIA